MLTEYAKSQGVDFQQYILEEQVIFEYSVGNLKKPNDFTTYYKNYLTLHNIPNQRQQFESQMKNYLSKGVSMLKEKNIL